ncbi:MAG: ABC transporter permease [Ardenticatenia bacterium]|nr:MAG: ABC transporter permease [Ardenticatenia bacterium]
MMPMATQEHVSSKNTPHVHVSMWRVRWQRFVEFARRYARNRMAVVGLAIVLTWVFVGLFAPWIAPYGYAETNYDAANQPPSLAHPLGTDALGRDQFSRMIWAARTALIVAPTATIVGVTLGLFLGLLAGYFGGWVDELVMRVSDVLFAFPGLLFALLLAATLQPRLAAWLSQFETLKPWVRAGYVEFFVVIIALSFVGWPGLARLVRGQVLSLREQQFVEAARATGVSSWRIMWRHIFPNALPPVIVALSMSMGGAVVAEASLSFLGIGISPPTPSWGAMIFNEFASWRSPAAPWLLWAPGLAVAALTFAFNFIGDGLNEALNPQDRIT